MTKSAILFTTLWWWTSHQIYSQPVELLSKLNSPYDEQNPVIDESTGILYFTRSRHPENINGERDPGDIWYSQLEADGTWSAPKNARVFNNSRWNGIIGFTNKGDILLHGHYESSNRPVRTQGIAIARKQGKGWGRPVNITIPYYRNLSSHFGGSISEDGNVLLLALEGYGTRGTEDIYVCFKKANGWTEAKNLGATINTKYQEFSPTMNENMDTLYFSSNGHESAKSSDVFMSVRLDDSWLRWSEPVLIDNINTAGKEMGYKKYDGYAVYTSTQNSDGYSDIKFHFDPETERPFKQPEEKIDTLLVTDLADDPTSDEEDGKTDTPTLFGYIIDAGSGDRIRGKISIITNEGIALRQVESTSQDKSYELPLPEPSEFFVRVEAPGYISLQEKLVINDLKPIEMNFSLQKIEVGAKVNLENVLFMQSKAEILPSSYEELNLVVQLMRDNPTMEIRLEGHTDNRGDAKQNLLLSKERVKAVQKYLVKRGISKKRVSGKGYGGSRPIANNDDPETRKLNRRVEFTIVKD